MPVFIGRVRRLDPTNPLAGFTPSGTLGASPAWLFAVDRSSTQALDSGAPILCEWHQFGHVGIADRVGILRPRTTRVLPVMADPDPPGSDAGTPAARGNEVTLTAAVERPMNVRGNLWLTCTTCPCAGNPGYCPSYLQPADNGVAANLSRVSGTRQQIEMLGTDTGTSIGGIPLITVSSAVPSGIVSTGAPEGPAMAAAPPGPEEQLNQILQPFGVSAPDVTSLLNQLGVQVQFT